MKEILILFGLVILQNASFTLVSRARNSTSLLYHGVASVLSNGIWLLVIRQVVMNLDNVSLMVTYVIAAVIGSIGMHYIAMKFFEKKKEIKVQKPTVGRIVEFYAFENSEGNNGVGVRPAIITNVHNDTCVGLRVFNGGLDIETRVIQGSDIGNWNWPKIK